MGKIVTVKTADGDVDTYQDPKHYGISPEDKTLVIEANGALSQELHHYPLENVQRFTIKITPDN